ncbi:MAG: hypothetical protein GTO22_19720, partial [Gemmatimonadales bacterium]|nr:hypothetical protein [Gemmatimonadales bacterium]
TFQLNEPAASATASDETALLIGAVSDPAGTFTGDEQYLHGDGLDNYVDFEFNS